LRPEHPKRGKNSGWPVRELDVIASKGRREVVIHVEPTKRSAAQRETWRLVPSGKKLEENKTFEHREG